MSILVSAISLIVSWAADRKVRIKENATNIRVAIANTMNKVNHVTQLQLSYYDIIEKDIVEAAEVNILQENPVKARNGLWKAMHEKRVELANAIRKEDWEIAYIDLLAYNVKIDTLYINTVDKLIRLDNNEFEFLLRQLEWETLEFEKGDSKQTAMLSNRLRQIKNSFLNDHKEKIEVALTPLHKKLQQLFNAEDADLLFPE